MKFIKSLLFLLLMFCLFVEIWIGFPVTIESQPPNRKIIYDEKTTGEAAQKMKGVHFVESKEGKRDWEFYAKAADGFEGKGVWELFSVKVNFYNSKKIDYTVLGDKGFVDTKTKDMKIDGNVKTTTINGYKILTQSISYKADQRKLFSTDKVVFSSEDAKSANYFQAEGVGIEAQVEKSEIEMKSDVVATHPLKDGRQFKVSSQSATFNTKEFNAIFKGKTKISIGEMVIEGPVARFYYKKGYDILKSVNMDGGVKIMDQAKTAVADTVKYDPENDIYILTGNPKVIQGGDEITGDQITFLEGGRKVLVDNMKAKVEQLKSED